MKSNTVQFDFSKKITSKKLKQFADIIIDLSNDIGFKVSSRGWGYLCEGRGYINKSQFDKVEAAINRCRKEGLLPVDFVAEEVSRAFEGIEVPSKGTVMDTLKWMLENVRDGQKYFTPDWWNGEEYYIQMVVEKIDLKTLFEPICSEYHIPIANAKGWQSILQRAEYAKRFKQAEDMGLKCVLLYAKDFDPDGGRIADTMRKNLDDLKDVYWNDGAEGYDPSDLEIDVFGLKYDFIIANNYTWIDNLMTGGDKDLSDPKHHNHKLPYVQNYLKAYGARKCESNVLVTTPDIGRDLCRESIVNWLGDGAAERFAAKRQAVKEEYEELLKKTKLMTPINKVLKAK